MTPTISAFIFQIWAKFSHLFNFEVSLSFQVTHMMNEDSFIIIIFFFSYWEEFEQEEENCYVTDDKSLGFALSRNE